MNKLILIIFIAFSYSADDWLKGNNNPNGKTLAISYTPSDFMMFDADGNSNVRSSHLQIPITDYFTISQSRSYLKKNGGSWEGGTPNTQISFHLPLNRLWE